MNNNIRDLQAQIETEKRKMQNCDHDFSEPVFNPEIIKVGYGQEMVELGSDTYFDYAGYRDKQINRWTRICKICGYEQHTKKRKPVISDYKPDFD